MRFHLLTLAVLLSSAAAHAGPSWGVALKGALLTEGEVRLDGDDFEAKMQTETAILGVVEAHRWVAEGFGIGVYGAFATLSVEDTDDGEATLRVVGATLKTRFDMGDATELRLGVNIGYQQVEPEDSDSDEINGLGVGATADLVFGTASTRFLGTVGFLSQPSGGNDDIELTFEPIWYFGAGVEFGG